MEGAHDKKTKLRAKWKHLFFMFRELKNRVTLFLKSQLASLIYLDSVTMVSESINSLHDVFFVLAMCAFHTYCKCK
jgi:hypothetical protein